MTGPDADGPSVAPMSSAERAPSPSPGANPALAAALLEKGILVGELLARGGHSLVYRARDERLLRDVAVKVIDVAHAPPAALERFRNEVAVVARLRHPHVLPLYDAGVAADGSIFAVMPLVTGPTLREFEHGRPLDERVAIGLAREIADALGYAHEQGIIHRDIKPENIFVEDGHAVVADFGLAVEGKALTPRQTAQDALRASMSDGRMTAAGSFVGTPLYASPEQVSGADVIGARSDLFSLAAVCYEMLTGSPPFVGATVQETLAARFTGPPAPMASHGVRVSSRVEAVIARTLAQDPARRPASARAFRDTLVEAYRARSQRATIAVIGLAAFLVLLGLALALTAERRRHENVVLRDLNPRRVVVADFDNETSDSAFAAWGDAAGEIITSRLARVAGLEVIPSRHWLARSAQPARQQTAEVNLRHVALETGAATVVTGGYYREKNRLDLILEVTDARSGVILRTYGPISAPANAPGAPIGALGDALGASLDSLLIERPSATPR